MKILVASCDANKDTFYPFSKCLEKYWPDHPKVVYSTETQINPYYTTVCKDYSLKQWSRRIRETLATLRDREILLMVDDAFIRGPVDTDRVAKAKEMLKNDVACVNFERVYDNLNDDIPGTDFKCRKHGAPWEVSIQCGLWDRKKLMDVLSEDMDPWTIEYKQPTKGYTYLINGGDYIIDYGYRNGQYFGLHNGKWCKEVVPFFKQEGLDVDVNLRGVE